MGYCLLPDVQGLNPKRTYNDSSSPTDAQVLVHIDTIADEIDLVMASAGYTVPLTTPTTLLSALKRINTYGAAALAEMAMFPETTGLGETAHWQILWKTYQGWLDLLRKGEIPLNLEVTNDPVGSYYTDVADQGEFPDPVFRKSALDKDF
jgi:hypothetical protein